MEGSSTRRHRAAFAVLLGVSVSIGISAPNEAFAGDHALHVKDAKVSVHVRTVMATDVKTNPSDSMRSVDNRLNDISSKLQKLHFRTFKLVSTQTRVVPIEKKEVINLGSGNTLIVRPVSVDDKRVGLWLHWTDGTGMEVLDTRMHFDSGDSMLTGTDHTGDTGMILAIDAEPVK